MGCQWAVVFYVGYNMSFNDILQQLKTLLMQICVTCLKSEPICPMDIFVVLKALTFINVHSQNMVQM